MARKDAADSANQIVVNGALNFVGPVTFQSYELEPSKGDWRGIYLTGTGTMNSTYDVAILHSTDGFVSQSSATTTFSSLRVEHSLYGASSLAGDLIIDECILDDITNFGLSVINGADLQLGAGSITNVPGGAIIVNDGKLTITGPLSMPWCTGISVSNAPAGSIIAGVTFTDCTSSAIYYDGGDWTLGPDIVVDGIFGTGLTGRIKDWHSDIIEEINESEAHVISIDVPSGVVAGDTEVPGPAVMADLTVTFACPKIAHLFSPASSYSGGL